MNKRDVLRYRDLLLAKQQELSSGKALANLVATTDEPRGDVVDMAASETESAVQARLTHTGGKLMRAIEQALGRIRQERFGTCEDCGQPISMARLEAVPWARYCRQCKDHQESGV